MKHLINREEYIKEYLRISNSVENDNELYEGLLSNVFGRLKTLLKRDWAGVKCKNPSVLKHLQEIDKGLDGYTMVKMQFPKECVTIRQNIADYFNDILDYKLTQVEKEDNFDKLLDEMDYGDDKSGSDIKDKTLLDSIDKYKANINNACKVSSKLKEYVNQMLNTIDIFVNNVVLSELEKKGADKAKLEEEAKKLEEEVKKKKEEIKKKNEESKKASEEAIKKLESERDDIIKSFGVNPIGPMDGDKAIDVITKQYSDMISEFNGIKLNESSLPKLPKNYKEILRSDTYIGIQKSLEELNWKWDDDKKEEIIYKFTTRVILNKINTAFNVISSNNDIKKLFNGTPSASVQAMMISISNAILYGFVGDDKFKIKNDEKRLSLMTKCAIDSDATIGFNLPLIDPKKPDNGNFFVSIMEQFRSDKISSEEVDDAIEMMKKEIDDIKSIFGESIDEKAISKFKEIGSDLMKNFRQNISNLSDIIRSKAKQIKEETKKAKEAESNEEN
jgi:hypothetical protein